MQRKIRILINGITFDESNLVPLREKINYWRKKNTEIILIGTTRLANKMGKHLFDSIIIIKGKPLVGGKFSFIKYAISRNFVAFKKWKDIKDIDIVYSISSVLDLTILPFFLKKTKKVKIWATVFDNTVPLFSGSKLISGSLVTRVLAWSFYQLSNLLLKSADIIFVVKPQLKSHLSGKGFQAKRLVVTGNGVQNDLIKKAKYRKKYDFDALYVGRINEAKGIYDMLSVVQIVKEVYPNLTLGIVGRGDDATERRYKSKIKELRLTRNVKLLGFKTGQEKFDIIKSSKVFLFLSETESVPIAPMEAVCSGKIALVYNLPAYNMYMNHEVTKFKMGDFESVANKILEITKKGEFFNKNGYALLEKYSWDTIAKKEISIFNKIDNNGFTKIFR